MSSGLLLDTRAPVRSTRMHVKPLEHPSQTSSTGLVFFRHLVQQLIRSNHRDRAALRQVVIERLRMSRDPMGYVGELLDQCVVDNRSEGMDIAIDVLTHFGGRVIEYAYAFWRKDVKRWETQPPHPRHHIHDDIWYVLLRAAGASNLDMLQKVAMLNTCAAAGTPVVREASVRALGDMGGVSAARLVRHLGETDASPMVREAAAEVLADLEV
jgi:hypothetical protein